MIALIVSGGDFPREFPNAREIPVEVDATRIHQALESKPVATATDDAVVAGKSMGNQWEIDVNSWRRLQRPAAAAAPSDGE